MKLYGRCKDCGQKKPYEELYEQRLVVGLVIARSLHCLEGCDVALGGRP